MSQGKPGPPGQPGISGKQGLRGLPGINGIQGLRGSPGVPGPPGTRGPQGFQGEMGSRGPQGFQGEMGSRGPQGNPGTPGPKGDPGISPAISHLCQLNKFLYPSTIHYNRPVDELRRLNMTSYNLYSENGWFFNDGVIKFPVKKCTQLGDIKSIMLNFYNIESAIFNINIVFCSSTITYSQNDVLVANKKYHATTKYNYQYDENLICLDKVNAQTSCEEIKEINIEIISGSMIASLLTIVYKDNIINFFLCNN